MPVGEAAVDAVITCRGKAQLRVKRAESALRGLALRDALKRLAQEQRVALVQRPQRGDGRLCVRKRLGIISWRGGDGCGVKCLAHGKVIKLRRLLSNRSQIFHMR